MKNLRHTLALVTSICIMICVLSSCALVGDGSQQAQTVTGSVIEIEDFGHAQLDISIDEFNNAGYELGDVVTVTFDSYEADMPYFDGYYSDPGELMVRAYAGDVNIAVCVNYGNFSELSNVKVGDPVTISMKEKAAALKEQEISSLVYSYERSDYESDEIFANFRPVTLGDIGENKLYRSASPINNICSRACFADELIEKVHIKTVMNLADSSDEIEAIFLNDDFDSPYYKTLYENGQVVALDMSVDFYSDEFTQGVAEGFEFLIEDQPPYLIHCNEGKDRTGFVIMLLEALMGAGLDEIKDDYMASYGNLFGVTEESEPEKYNAIMEKNLMKMLYKVTGIEEGESLESVDLKKAAADYLLNAGMTDEQIDELVKKLT